MRGRHCEYVGVQEHESRHQLHDDVRRRRELSWRFHRGRPNQDGWGWFGALLVGYGKNFGDDARRSPALTPTAGGTVQDKVNLDYDWRTVGLRGGWSFATGLPGRSDVALWVGGQYHYSTLQVKVKINRDFPQGTISRFNSENEARKESWRPWFGIDFRFWRDWPFYGRVEASVGDKDVDVQAKLSCHVDIPRMWQGITQ